MTREISGESLRLFLHIAKNYLREDYQNEARDQQVTKVKLTDNELMLIPVFSSQFKDSILQYIKYQGETGNVSTVK